MVDTLCTMKDIISSVPPSILFLAGFVSVVSIGAFRLAAMLQAAIG